MNVWRRGFQIFKVEHDRVWQCVYNFKPEFGFFSKENSMFNLEENRLSLISHIGNERLIHRYNSSFEFLLEYPSEYPGEYNHWIQSKNPIDENIADNSNINKVDGYVPIHINWTRSFGGLAKNTFNTCVLDGNVGSDYWNYAIGDYNGLYIPKTPGPLTSVSYVILWIRIDPSKYFFRTIRCNRGHNHVFVFVVVLLLSK